MGGLIHWLVRSNEHTNFTYHLSALNKKYLASFLATALDEEDARIVAYMRELEEDSALSGHLRGALQASPVRHVSDSEIRYSRRLGWYALVRATKPKVVIETGVHRGLGSCVIAAALKKNAEEGSPGFLYGTDIDPSAGFLLSGPYAEYGKILYGDSLESLGAIEGPIDLFINDSDHSPGYEAREYEVVAPKLAPGAILVSDNAHACDALREYSLAAGRRFLFFREQPAGHWYPGGGIGISYPRKPRGVN